MDIFDISELISERSESGARYLEFFKAASASMSLGIYELSAGADDPQQPHTEDEIYYVARGRGRIRIAGEDRKIAAGNIVFVGAGVEHRFHSIAEDLTLLVVFAPARGSAAGD